MNGSSRALTIRQPWAALVVSGRKVIEYRGWSTAHRGRIWIHAGRALDPDAPPALTRLCDPLTFSAIIGHADLYAIDGAPGAWRWHLRDPHELAQPVSCRGWPSLWPIPGEVITELYRARPR